MVPKWLQDAPKMHQKPIEMKSERSGWRFGGKSVSGPQKRRSSYLEIATFWRNLSDLWCHFGTFWSSWEPKGGSESHLSGKIPEKM